MTTKPQAFELLRRADPASSLDWQRLSEHAVARLEDVLSTVTTEPLRAQRAPRPRLVRPLVGLVVGLAIAVAGLLVAPALGLGIPGIDFFRADKAPPKAVENFDSLSVGAPAGMDPRVIAGEARRVETPTLTGGKRTVWVAPTRAGGFCYLWARSGGGGCDTLGTTPLSVSWWALGPVLSTDPSALAPTAAPSRLGGIAVHTSRRYVARVEIRFADGAVLRPPITWVSEPIDAGFFFYRFTPEQRAPGHQVKAVVALDEDGNLVTEQGPCCEEEVAPPRDAITSEKNAAVSVSTVAGPAVIWVAPTRYDGTCAWFEFGGRVEPLGRCSAKGYDWNDGIVLRLYRTRDTVLIYGSAADRYRELEFHYADGDLERLVPNGRFFLAEIPHEHLQPGTRLLMMTVRGADGQEIPSAKFFFPQSRTRPCLRVLPGGSCADR